MDAAARVPVPVPREGERLFGADGYAKSNENS